MRFGVGWLRLGVEVLGALVIAAGVGLAAGGMLRRAFGSPFASFDPVRLQLARYLALALELQLAADILSTAIAPGWEQIGKLAAIAVIRTGLNYFLMLEMKEEKSSACERSGQARRSTEAHPDSTADQA